MADVFLSYSQKDRPAVERVAAGLKSLGLDVWYDARLDSGSSFDEVINAELREAKAVLACWSPDSIASKWPRAEAMLAYDKHKLVAAFIRLCELTPPFNLVHTCDLADWAGEASHAGWRNVARSLGRMCGRPGVGALAEALADGSQESVAAWAKRFPDEPLAREMWASRRAHLRHEFARELEAARGELAAALDKRRSQAETALARACAAFEAWLETERVSDGGPRPAPQEIARGALAEPSEPRAQDQAEIERLTTALAEANARAEAAVAARAGDRKQIERLAAEVASQETIVPSQNLDVPMEVAIRENMSRGDEVATITGVWPKYRIVVTISLICFIFLIVQGYVVLSILLLLASIAVLSVVLLSAGYGKSEQRSE